MLLVVLLRISIKPSILLFQSLRFRENPSYLRLIIVSIPENHPNSQADPVILKCTAMKQLPHVFTCMLFSFFLSINLQAQLASLEFPAYPTTGYSSLARINDLSAAAENKKINLEWSVPPYTQATTFIIERSMDGENFEVIGSDATAISDAAKKSFSFIDKPGMKAFKASNIFYRVGSLSENNEYLYTKPLMVSLNHTGNVDFITVLPNISDNNINLTVGVKENSYIVARIINVQGHEILNQKGKVHSGGQEFTLIGTNCLSPGTYWLEVMLNGKTALNLKLLKD